MKDTLDAIFAFLWNASQKIASVNLWPYVIALIVLMFAISIAVQYKQIKTTSRKFSEGAIDDKTVKICQKIRRRSIFPQAALIHDLYCCRLGSMHLERNEEALSFANINDIKNITEQISWRLHLLLAAYLTNQRYLDLANQYREQKQERQNVADWLKAQQLTYDVEKLSAARAQITNPQVMEIFKALTEHT